MKVLLVIDHFGSGGAQRQLVNLATGLKNSGHAISIFIYYPEYNFYRNFLERNSIEIIDFHKNNKGISVDVFFELRSILKKKKYDVALAYLDTPSIYLILSSIGCRIPVVVSDRSSYHGATNTLSYGIKRKMFKLADYVVANSETQKKWLVESAGLSSGKVTTIYNGFDPAEFSEITKTKRAGNNLNLIAIGGIRPVKNIRALIKAMELFHVKHKWLPGLTWVGRPDSLEYEKEMISLLAQRPEIQSVWKWMGERDDIPSLLSSHDALILPSHYEGLPNVVCEALFAGKPVLASNVCDNPVLVEEGVRGFLFNPDSPESIVEAVEKLLKLNDDDLERMCVGNRDYAFQYLTLETMVENYLNLFKNIID